jgi:hypothetical protein
LREASSEIAIIGIDEGILAAWKGPQTDEPRQGSTNVTPVTPFRDVCHRLSPP